MKLLIVLAVAAIVGFQNSGRQPGAAISNTFETCEQHEVASSGLAPGAIKTSIAATTFATIDIIIDPNGQTLGAYQFELTSEDASFTVVGVEGGGHAAFDHGRPPYFDPVAKQGEIDRLILADYARPALGADQLPSQAVRVATVHVMFNAMPDEAEQPMIQLTLTAAGNANGERIDAEISYTFRTPEPAPERPQ